MRTVLHQLAVILPLVGLLTWLSLRSIGPQGAEYVFAQRDVARVSLAEAGLRSEVLQARAGLLRDDDPIVHDMDVLADAAAELRGQAMVPVSDRELPVALQALVARDAVALERFKTDNALLQNSLSYFDLLDTELSAAAVPPELAAAIRALGNVVLHLMRDPSAPVEDVMRRRIDAVAALAPQAGPHRGELDLLTVHARLLARLLPGVDADLRALFDISTYDLRQAIRQGQDRRRMAEETRAARYRLVLYGVAVLLAAMLVRAGLQRRLVLRRARERAAAEHAIAELSTRLIATPFEQADEMFALLVRRLAETFRADRAYLLFPHTGSEEHRWNHASAPFPHGWPVGILAPLLAAPDTADLVHVPDAAKHDRGPLRDALLAAGVSGWCGFVFRDERQRIGLLAVERLVRDPNWPHGGPEAVRMGGEVAFHAVQRLLATRKRRELETRLARTNRLEAVGSFASGIAHNFNNLIAAVLGHAEMAGEVVPPDAAPAYHLGEIRRAGARARELVGRILAFGTRPGARFQPVDARRLIAEACDVLRVLLPEGVELVCEPVDPGLQLRGDAVQLQQVLVNLGRNAAEAIAGAGRITLRADRCRLDVPQGLAQGTAAAGEHVRIRLSDTGSGMTAATIARIFQPFFTGRSDGTGLGLATARDIVGEHGGGIDVRSEPGRGSEFSVWLPALGVDAPDVPEDLRGAGETILVLGPDPRQVLQDEEMLAALSYEPVGFHDLDAAIGAARAAPDRFDALLLDPGRPQRAVLNTLSRLRAPLPDRPVLLVADADPGTATTALAEMGVVAVLARPLRSAALAGALATALPARPVS